MEEVRRWQVARPWLSTLVRLGLAAVWLVAGLSKVNDLQANVRAVRAYRLLPDGVAQVLGSGQPVLEIALGLLLLAGLGIRVSATISAILLLLFIAGIASAAVRGLQIDCGCFSQGGDLSAGQNTHYTQEILRDVGFLAMSAFLVIWSRGRFSVDAALFPPLEADGGPAGDSAGDSAEDPAVDMEA